MNAQRTAGAATTSSGGSSSIPSELQGALNTYKAKYAAYAVSGQPGDMTARDTALATINQMLSAVSSTATRNDTYIQSFIDTYSTTNSDIISLQAKSRDIRTQGPALQNTLAQAQQMKTATIPIADDISLYVKAAIVVGLVVVVGIVTAS